MPTTGSHAKRQKWCVPSLKEGFWYFRCQYSNASAYTCVRRVAPRITPTVTDSCHADGESFLSDGSADRRSDGASNASTDDKANVRHSDFMPTSRLLCCNRGGFVEGSLTLAGPTRTPGVGVDLWQQMLKRNGFNDGATELDN